MTGKGKLTVEVPFVSCLCMYFFSERKTRRGGHIELLAG